jgi:iron complex outermembrane recepter protein
MRPTFLIAAACFAQVWAARVTAQTEPVLEEIIVTAEFREAAARDLPLSVTVIDAEELRATSVQHWEELTGRVPNLSFSGEGSRARYFQLRGIGELEQYEGAPNPSVGFVIDDVDFSSLGSIGTLFDMERVEVLRGPQGTRYGANALGGLIYMRSARPTEELSADFEATAGNDGTRGLGVAVGGPIGPSLGYRFSVHQYESNGFRDNAHLGRDDTYGRDELSARARFEWRPGDRVQVDFTGFHVDVDNGYDAWAIDNGFTTYSDKPGKDAQRSNAASVRVSADLDHFTLVSISGAARSDVTFSFDADWGNDDFWDPFVYDFVVDTRRERTTYNQELRLLSEDGAIAGGRGQWLVGAYVLDLSESNDRLLEGVYADGVFCDPCVTEDRVVSDYGANNTALFGQIDLAASDRLELTAGLRWERRSASYADTSGNRFDPTDDMMGGDLTLSWRLAEGVSTYARLARGYKAGGFNIDFAGVDFGDVDGITPEDIQFGRELLWNLELGVKGQWLDGRLWADASAFRARRENQQIKIPMQLRLGDPTTFVFLTANADRSTHTGLEAALAWRPLDGLTLSGALGLLETKISRFSLFPGLEGREQAHAPSYTFALGAEYRARSGWWARVDVTGQDEFFFDYAHDQVSTSYALTNLRVGRDWGALSVTLWARNLFDEEYYVRGFFFGNEPPDFPDTLYTRLGDPRHFGVTLRYGL